jgi:hypothetical protein
LKKLLILFVLIFSLLIQVLPVSAQCSMCRRVAETNQESNANRVGKTLNSGILYLMAVPYLLGAIGVAFWWKNKNKE